MNYGYADEKQKPVELSEKDEWNRYPIQLYHHLVADIEPEGSDILDIGSGRGGGAAYMSRRFNPNSVTGVDLSTEAVRLCQTLHGESDKLKYVQGDAEALPFENEEYDIVTSVEATHCFSSMARFLKEVGRVLVPGGDFVFTDFRSPENFEVLSQEIEDAENLELLTARDITQNVLLALDLDHDRKERFRDEHLKDVVQERFAYFAAMKGSETHEAFVSGNYLYKTFHLKRSE